MSQAATPCPAIRSTKGEKRMSEPLNENQSERHQVVALFGEANISETEHSFNRRFFARSLTSKARAVPHGYRGCKPIESGRLDQSSKRSTTLRRALSSRMS